MEQDKVIEKLSELLEDLGFDYDRMSQSGQQTYEEIMTLIAQLNM